MPSKNVIQCYSSPLDHHNIEYSTHPFSFGKVVKADRDNRERIQWYFLRYMYHKTFQYYPSRRHVISMELYIELGATAKNSTGT